MALARLNEREANPNPYISFISALPVRDASAQEDSRQLLRALAAQVKPLMRAHGFIVTNLEEYQFNEVFAGRNWNGGETVELVLRGPHGGFHPASWLLSTFCHELAHIKHMNHGPAFQALWAQLRREVRELQNKGYYGDGLWSSGRRLADSARVSGQGLDEGELPEYICGGAHSRTRPSSLRRLRRQPVNGPSNHTGRQTGRKRKAGGRVTAKGTFEGGGRALNEDVDDEDAKKAGAGFRKKAGSKSAREARALAAERRLSALQSSTSGPSSTSAKPEPSEDTDSGSDSDENNDSTQFVAETDQDRRRTMLESDGDGKGLKASFGDFVDDFVFPTFDGSDSEMQAASRTGPTISSGSSKGKGKEKAPARSGEVPQPPSKRPRSEISSKGKGKGKGSEAIKPLTDFFAPASTSRVPGDSEPGEQAPKKKTRKTTSLSYGNFVQGEVRHRKKEALGMQAGSSRTLSDARQAASAGRSRLLDMKPAGQASSSEHSGNRDEGQGWTCLVCTLSNQESYLACAACGATRSESS
ncbi:WLM-domain-containing protein [Trametopsis cervina]|nr:WLM-domain-containing protein [Trametopsis cervina]